jgi:hypothetical protein
VTYHTSDKVTSPKFSISAIDLRPPAGAEFWRNRAVFFAENDRQSACMYMTLAACLDRQNVLLWVNAFFFAWNWLLSAGMDSDRTYFQYFLSVLYLTGRHWIGRSFDAVLWEGIEAKKGDPRYQSLMKDFVGVLAEEADRRLKLTRKEKGYFTFRLYDSGERD